MNSENNNSRNQIPNSKRITEYLIQSLSEIVYNPKMNNMSEKVRPLFNTISLNIMYLLYTPQHFFFACPITSYETDVYGAKNNGKNTPKIPA